MSFSCIICQKTFTTKQSLEYHNKRNVCKTKEENQCGLCNVIFSTKQRLEYHVKNAVCSPSIVPEDVTTKMLEMYDMIKTLQQRMSSVENENKILKEDNKILKDDNKILKDSIKLLTSKPKATKKLSDHIEYKKINGKTVTIFKINEDTRYSIINSKKGNDEIERIIWASIDKNTNYQPLTDDEEKNILLGFNETIKIDRTIYQKCINMCGINLRGDKDKDDDEGDKNEDDEEDDEEQEEKKEEVKQEKEKEKEQEDIKHEQEEEEVKQEEDVKQEEEGDINIDDDEQNEIYKKYKEYEQQKEREKVFFENDFFIGTTLKKAVMSEYKNIYKEYGVNAFLSEIPQRLSALWSKSDAKLLEFLNM